MAEPDVTIAVLDWARAAASAMPLREAVFVVEQSVPRELERDARDPVCHHAIARESGGAVIGTGRLLLDGHIGRMAVANEWRARGVGGRILEALVAEARTLGMPEVVLHAQVHAEAFYRRHGFVPEGEIFIEAGIEHRLMRRPLV